MNKLSEKMREHIKNTSNRETILISNLKLNLSFQGYIIGIEGETLYWLNGNESSTVACLQLRKHMVPFFDKYISGDSLNIEYNGLRKNRNTCHSYHHITIHKNDEVKSQDEMYTIITKNKGI